MLVMSLIQLAGVITGNAGIVRIGTLGWVLLAYPIVPSIVYALFFTRGRKDGGTVPGAADNLSACALAVAMCRFLVKNPSYIPDDTEIRFISFGSEEAGLRGSRRYVERHLDELKRLDARLLNYRDDRPSGDHHPHLGDERHREEFPRDGEQRGRGGAARRGPLQGDACHPRDRRSDAGPFSQAGLKATTLLPFKMPQQMVAFYHQKWDTPEVLTIEPLLNVLKLTLEWVRKWRGYDEIMATSAS